MRPFHELLHRDDALLLIRQAVAASPHPAELLSRPAADGRRALEALQVTTRSHLGALAHHTGGLLVDGGWLRILGAGCKRLPRAIDTWNGLGTDQPRCPHGLLVADDAMGGFFAWFREPARIHYFAPDSMAWEDLGMGYGAWLEGMLSDRYERFYGPLRWEGWQRDVADLGPDQGLLTTPALPFAHQGPRTRAPVPMDELWRAHMHLARQIADLPDGATVKIDVVD